MHNDEEESYQKMLLDLTDALGEAHANASMMIAMLEETKLNEMQKSIVRVARTRLLQSQEKFFIRFKP
jgi:hypothetical protein